MTYLIPAKPVEIEYEVKRSRFLCTINHCPTRTVAETYIQELSTRYRDANHNCWAMIAGSPTDPHGYGMSDDGEPRGCAGKPMFTVLQHSGIGEIAVVVSRWFGGIKLGTGGMARAYSTSVQQGLAALTTLEKIFYSRYTLTLPYELQQNTEHLIQLHKGHIRNHNYDVMVTLVVDIPEEKALLFIREIEEKGQGRILCQSSQ